MTDALFLTVPQVANLLEVSTDLVYELIHRGELPAAKLGMNPNPRYRIPRRAIDLVLDEALKDFDPAALLARLVDEDPAAAADPSAGPPVGSEGSTTTTRPTEIAPQPDHRTSAGSAGAPVAVVR